MLCVTKSYIHGLRTVTLCYNDLTGCDKIPRSPEWPGCRDPGHVRHRILCMLSHLFVSCQGCALLTPDEQGEPTVGV
jgi:hypothetical protein